ncbi:MAG: polyprenyl diphosphate synthase [Wenzhouxiangellaceae bacterium]|nr:polyprenyl diphosphate synthase [Wenzhouxiangellaceae bacterium]
MQPGSLPCHLAIIMDGNGRWARRRGKPRTYGHQAGTEAARKIVRAVAERGIRTLTVYAFSSENWSRPRTEVNRLMSLFRRALDREIDDLHANGVRLNFIGNRQTFPKRLQAGMNRAELITRDNDRLVLNIAASYGARDELVQAARALAREAAAGRLDPDAIDEDMLDDRTALAGQPPPDLLIRTGGEKRLSNYLLWHLAYTELVFSDVLWPDFTEQHLDQALADFASRERRYGGVPYSGEPLLRHA